MPTALEPLRAILDALPASMRGEILDGRLTVTPRPTNLHQLIIARLIVQFAAANERELVALPEPELRLGEDVLVPDVAVWFGELPAAYATEPPALVVEVLSPSTRAYDRHEKVERYAALGVPHVWLVDPDARTIESVAGGVRSVTAHSAALLSPFRTLRLDLDALWP
jgi:Uma2 family endonuclease